MAEPAALAVKGSIRMLIDWFTRFTSLKAVAFEAEILVVSVGDSYRGAVGVS